MPTAHPIADLHGDYARVLKNKPAAIVRRLEGHNVLIPTAKHCTAVGHALAQIHILGESFSGVLANPRGIAWAVQTADRIFHKLSTDDQQLLEQEIQLRRQPLGLNLPQGIVHADLFRDNMMFKRYALTGIIDFYLSCSDYLLYDLAIAVNDWCSDDEGNLDTELYAALIEAYRMERQFHDCEFKAWEYMLRAAALRFWLSRLRDQMYPKDGEITHTKDPDVFKKILLSRIDCTPNLDF